MTLRDHFWDTAAGPGQTRVAARDSVMQPTAPEPVQPGTELSPVAMMARGMAVNEPQYGTGYSMMLARNDKGQIFPLVEDALDGRPICRGTALRAEQQHDGSVSYLGDLITQPPSAMVNDFRQSTNSPLLGQTREGGTRLADAIELARDERGDMQFNIDMPGHPNGLKGTLDPAYTEMLDRLPVTAPKSAKPQAEVAPVQRFAAAANDPSFG